MRLFPWTTDEIVGASGTVPGVTEFDAADATDVLLALFVPLFVAVTVKV